MVWNEFAYKNSNVLQERVVLAGIPCLRYYPTNAPEKQQTVVYYHGWQSSKEFQHFKASILSCYGYQVFVPDAILHGERNPIDYDKPGALEEHFWKIVINTVQESSQLIDTIINTYQPVAIGVMGTSMGGFSSAGVFAHNPLVKCLVNINGSCAWIKTEEFIRKQGGLTPMGEKQKQYLGQYDPLPNKSKLQVRPILMLHGDNDKTVPVQGQREFYQEVSPCYKNYPERLQLIELPEVDHYTTLSMMQSAIDWLKLYL